MAHIAWITTKEFGDIKIDFDDYRLNSHADSLDKPYKIEETIDAVFYRYFAESNILVYARKICHVSDDMIIVIGYANSKKQHTLEVSLFNPVKITNCLLQDAGDTKYKLTIEAETTKESLPITWEAIVNVTVELLSAISYESVLGTADEKANYFELMHQRDLNYIKEYTDGIEVGDYVAVDRIDRPTVRGRVAAMSDTAIFIWVMPEDYIHEIDGRQIKYHVYKMPYEIDELMQRRDSIMHDLTIGSKVTALANCMQRYVTGTLVEILSDSVKIKEDSGIMCIPIQALALIHSVD